jgi:hypothetical protein
MKIKSLIRLPVVVALAMSMNSVVISQSFTSSVSGRVLDQQGAVVTGATVTLKNAATGFAQQGVADSAGNFQFFNVSPGRYLIIAQREGFAQSQTRIDVSVSSQTRADVTLRVGTVTEQVQVSANEIINPFGSGVGGELSNIVTQHQVIELPTITRNVYELINLSPGVAPTSDSRGVSLSVNGQRSASGNYILDGGESNDTFNAGPSQRVPLDAIQEFRVMTNNYPAEYGRGSGFIANIVTKTGSNDLHGSVYLYNRNSALSANTFDNNANGLDKPIFNRNQFGGSAGGPIKKEKAFFFGTIEPILVRSIASRTFFVPTQRLIDLSSPGTKALFQKYPLPSDISTTNVRTRTVCPFGATCNTQTGAGFVTIPAFAFVSRTGPANVGAGSPQDTYLATGRIDYNLDSKTQLFGRYAFDDEDFIPDVRQPYSAELDRVSSARGQNILLNLNRTWSTSLITETRLGYNRFRFGAPTTPSPAIPRFLNIEGDVVLPGGIDGFGNLQNLYQIYQNASWIRGRHVLKFGGQYVQIRDKREVRIFESAQASFSGSLRSGDCGVNQAISASFLGRFTHGCLSSFSIALDLKTKLPGESLTPPFGPPSVSRHFHYNEWVVFFQDTWQVKPRLTLTPGIRWEYFGVPYGPGHERSLDSNFYYGPGSDVYQRIASGTVRRTDAIIGDLRERFYRPDYNNFSPRLGLAYDIFGDGKTVFRSGVGIYYDRNFGNVLTNVTQNPPYGLARLTNVLVTPQRLQNQYDAFPNAAIPTDLLRLSIVHLDENIRTAYTLSWNAAVQRNIKNSVLVTVAYVGASGNKLYGFVNINRVGSFCLLGDDRNCQDTKRLNQRFVNINNRNSLGHSTYHGLQVSAESSYIQKLGLQFGMAYSWSHSIDNNSSFFGEDLVANSVTLGFSDPFDPSIDRGNSDFDIRHRFQTNFVWDIPLGRNSTNRFVKNVFGGWGVSGLLTFQTGQPFSIFDTLGPAIEGSFEVPLRPRLTGQPDSTTFRPDALNPNTFLYLPLNLVRYSVDPVSFDFVCSDPRTKPFACGPSINGPFNGMLSRNTFRRPGTQFHNIALFKNFNLPKMFGREGNRLQLRAEFYNLFNHSNLYVEEFSNDVTFDSFNESKTKSTAGVIVRRGDPQGLTESFVDNRQVVIALKFIF